MSYVVLGFCFDEIIDTLYEYVLLWFHLSGEFSVIMLFSCLMRNKVHLAMESFA